MKGLPFNLLEKVVVEVAAAPQEKEEEREDHGEAAAAREIGGIVWRKGEALKEVGEPRSVLDHRSPSSPTSTSTPSPYLGGGAGGGGSAAVSGDPAAAASRRWPPSSVDGDSRRDEWMLELLPIPGAGGGADDFQTMFQEPAAAASPEQDNTFLPWIMCDVENTSSGFKHHQLLSSPPPPEIDAGDHGCFGLADTALGFEHGFPCAETSFSGGGRFASSSNHQAATATAAELSSIKVLTFRHLPPSPANNSPIPPSLPPELFIATEEKPLFSAMNLLQNHGAAGNPAFFFPSPSFMAAEHHHHHLLDHRVSAGAGDELAAAAIVEQLFKAAEMVETGNSAGARGILTRLNHHLPSPVGNSHLRSAFYFKEAFQLLLLSAPPSPSPAAAATAMDVILKLGAYKAFSDVSPVLQFTNFTSVQALLEELGTSGRRIHIVDFDIGIGGQWSSFMLELAHRRRSSAAAPPPFLKITALVDPTAHHPLELHLIREILTDFAADHGIPFEFEATSLDCFDPAAAKQDDEAIAVKLSINHSASNLSVIQLIKQLSPEIVIAVGHGGGGGDGELSFSRHFLREFQSSVVLLDSIDAWGATIDAASTIERFLLRPRIESAVLWHRRGGAGEKTLPSSFQELLASSGFVPLKFSDFTEIQGECLLRRVQVRGFRIERRRSSLSLFWKSGELAAVSAWRCC